MARLRSLPRAEAIAALERLSVDERAELFYAWEVWRRPSQILPTHNPRTSDGRWSTWLINAGRGFGKTRVGAETVRAWVRDFKYVNIIGATVDDARDIMIEGESGIMAVCPKHERPLYKMSSRKLVWPNGASSLIFTADEPERLRGKQHEKLWCDELAAWRYPESWDQARFGLRLGSDPQSVVTTTPRPSQIVKDLIADPSTFVTRGTTYDNKDNLAPSFFSHIISKYEGTRLGRQELLAEVLDDNPNALWRRSDIDKARCSKEALPHLRRIVVAIDPAVTSDEGSDYTGIIVAGMDDQKPAHFYVLTDNSLIATPNEWARKAVSTYYAANADRVVAEVNNGGDLVETVLRTVDPNIPYTAVRASRGKAVRAEPIAALYEQGRVHHVGVLDKLEDQLCDFDPLRIGARSPDRMDALVWAITELSEGYTSPEPIVMGNRTYR